MNSNDDGILFFPTFTFQISHRTYTWIWQCVRTHEWPMSVLMFLKFERKKQAIISLIRFFFPMFNRYFRKSTTMIKTFWYRRKIVRPNQTATPPLPSPFQNKQKRSRRLIFIQLGFVCFMRRPALTFTKKSFCELSLPIISKYSSDPWCCAEVISSCMVVGFVLLFGCWYVMGASFKCSHQSVKSLRIIILLSILNLC